MALGHQAISHHLSPCWPRSLPPYDITMPQYGNNNIFLQPSYQLQNLHNSVLHLLTEFSTDDPNLLRLLKDCLIYDVCLFCPQFYNMLMYVLVDPIIDDFVLIVEVEMQGCICPCTHLSPCVWVSRPLSGKIMTFRFKICVYTYWVSSKMISFWAMLILLRPRGLNICIYNYFKCLSFLSVWFDLSQGCYLPHGALFSLACLQWSI